MTSHKLARFCQRMSTITFVIMVFILVMNTACWIFPDMVETRNSHGLAFALNGDVMSNLAIDTTLLPWWQKLGGIVLTSIPLIALVTGLYHLRRLFQNYGQEKYFSMEAADHLGRFGRAVLIWVTLNIVFEPVLSIWLTMLAPEGERMITLSFTSFYLVALFLAACITVIAHILRQASELHSENRQFI